MESLPDSFSTEEDFLLFQKTFQEVRVIKPRDFCDVLSNGETIGEFYRRTGKNKQNQEIYDKWVSPTMISMCIRTLKKNPDVTRLPNGLTPTTFSIDHVTGRYASKKVSKKNVTKKSKHKVAKQQSPQPLSLPPINTASPASFSFPSMVSNVDEKNPPQTPTKTMYLDISPQTSQPPTPPTSPTDNHQIEYVFGLSND